MRRDWRNVLAALALFLVGTTAVAAPQDGPKEAAGSGGDVVRLTVEVRWGTPHSGAELVGSLARGHGDVSRPEYVLELTQGRVIDAMPWPSVGSPGPGGSAVSTVPVATGPGSQGSWRLGSEPEGRVAPGSKRHWMPASLCAAAIIW